MSKQKVMAIVIAAVVVIAGVAVAVPVLRNRVTSTKEESTTAPVVETVTNEETTVIEGETETVEETVTDDAGEPITRTDGKVVTTIRTVKKTATTKANSSTTKKSSSGTIDTGSKTVDKALYSMEQLAVLGYKYNSSGDYFYTDDKDCWQKGYGYNEVYDQAAQFGVMFIDKLRIRFDYAGKAWMIQLWKGQYGWLFIGGEIGVYTTDKFKTADAKTNSINHYDCADQSDWLNMSMDIYWDGNKDGSYEKLFSRPYTKYWWCTGFKYGTLNKYTSPISELIMKARVTFKSTEMASLFTRGMKQSGFGTATSSGSLGNDTIYQSGADTYFRWRSKFSAAFTDVTSSGDSGSVSINSGSGTQASTAADSAGTTKTTSIWDMFTTQPSGSTTTTTKANSSGSTTTTTTVRDGDEKPF